jgi:hypothetical protein
VSPSLKSPEANWRYSFQIRWAVSRGFVCLEWGFLIGVQLVDRKCNYSHRLLPWQNCWYHCWYYSWYYSWYHCCNSRRTVRPSRPALLQPTVALLKCYNQLKSTALHQSNVGTNPCNLLYYTFRHWRSVRRQPITEAPHSLTLTSIRSAPDLVRRV